MDNYFDFDQAAIPPLDLTVDLSAITADTHQLDSTESFDSLFLENTANPGQDSLALSQTDVDTIGIFPHAIEEPEPLIIKLINDKEVEAVRWQYSHDSELPMFKAKTPCSLCARQGMDCFLATRGALVTGCTACISLYRDCSFVHPQLPKGMFETFPGIAEDEQVCHGAMNQKKANMASFNNGEQRGRKSGARFHRDAVKILKAWLVEHHEHPYPNERERDELKQLTGLKRSQINNWLANARRRGKVRSTSGPASPVLGALDIPGPKGSGVAYEDLNPLDRWKCSPPDNEPASMTAIARAVATNPLPVATLQTSRTSSRRASSEDDSSNLSIMFQPPSISSFETRGTTNSTFSLASSQSHNSRHSFASSQERRRRRRAPLLQRANQRAGGASAARNVKQRQQGAKERIFQCTFCTESFPSKFDWKRHEKALHLALERWICCPMGGDRIDPPTGLRQCVFCPTLGDPTEEHLEKHNFLACHEKTIAERTFYRKDHLRQHLRLVHGTKYEPHMDLWRSTTFEVKSACGFCPSLFTTWDARADHLAAHFRNGADMKDWTGGWGFEPFVERLVENALPPYLIAHDRNSMDPFRAREVPSSGLSSATQRKGFRDQSVGNQSVASRPDVDQRTKDSQCWRRVEEELIKFVMERKAKAHLPTDRELQDHARVVVYGDADPLDWTMADNETWLQTFKCEHGLSPSTVGPDGPVTPEYTSTRAVPVTAPYVVKGGLKKTTSRAANSEMRGKRHSTSSISAVQERSCADLALVSTNSSFTNGTPMTPVDSLLNYDGAPVALDTQHMMLDFEAMDFDQLDLNAFGEMEFEPETASAQIDLSYTENGHMTTFGPPLENGTGPQKSRPLTPNPFMSLDEAPEITLEAFDHLTGYRESFR